MIKRQGVSVVNTSSLKASLVTGEKSCLYVNFRERALGTAIVSPSYDSLQKLLWCLHNANPSDTPENCSQKQHDPFLEQHIRHAVFRAVWKNEMVLSILCRCNPSEALG